MLAQVLFFADVAAKLKHSDVRFLLPIFGGLNLRGAICCRKYSSEGGCCVAVPSSQSRFRRKNGSRSVNPKRSPR